MITQDLNTATFAQFSAEVLSDMAGRLLPEQAGIADVYLRRSGWLAQRLASGIYTVTQTENGANLKINYPERIRFLDLKRARSGKMKKVYHPIYNRPFYGFTYGYAFARLRAALNQNVRDAMVVDDKLVINVSV
jgi:hypothetical protein